ncbi:hypothetical protein MAR_037121 [Mya arenaria]|uniref:Uncharacterized protein n=1 Tax=Mya arenaria TaxID=6604 RepID=A0ABY7FMT7_MYAAR|nr:hypothetical protein MAR_037121 [Mya arenaria]
MGLLTYMGSVLDFLIEKEIVEDEKTIVKEEKVWVKPGKWTRKIGKMAEHPPDDTSGAPVQKKGKSVKTVEEIMLDLSNNMEKFSSIAKSVAEMKQSMQNIQKKKQENDDDETAIQGPSKKLCTETDTDEDETGDELDMFLEEETPEMEEQDELLEELGSFCMETTDTADAITEKHSRRYWKQQAGPMLEHLPSFILRK